MAIEMEPTLDDSRSSGRGYGPGFVDDYPGQDTDVSYDRNLPVPRVSESSSRLPVVGVADAPTDSDVEPVALTRSRRAGGSHRTGETPVVAARIDDDQSVAPRRIAASDTGKPKSRLQLTAVIGLLLGAAVMLSSAALSQTIGAVVPVVTNLANAPVPPNERPLSERPPPPTTPGTCLSWQRSDAADASLTDCAASHLFEQVGAVQLTQFGPNSPLPDNESFRELVNQQCSTLVSGYLHSRYDPNGAFRAGALKPSSKSWFDGNRTMRCGLQRFSRSGALYPITGKVADQDQSDVRPAGSCLGIDGKFIGDPVNCAQPHAVQSVGSVDLSQKFTKFPQPGDQDKYLQPQCTKLASNYAGGEQALANKNLSVMWDNLRPESWQAGTHRVACNLAAQLPDHSGFAAITGDAKGKVSVANQVAPPAPQTSAPGAPAEGSVPAPTRERPARGNEGGDVNPTQPTQHSSPPSELPHAPRLPQLPNPFGSKDDNSRSDPLTGNRDNQPPNPLGTPGKPLLGGGDPGN